MSVKYESPSNEISTSITQGRNLFSRKKKARIGLNAINVRSARITLIPVFVLLFVFLALPMINSIQLSVSRWGGLGPLESVGFDNYKFLFSDPQMRYSSRITIFYAFSVAFFVVAIATLLAVVDGANVRQQFTKITLPLIRPILMTIFTLQIIWTFNGFTVVWAMTNGGPSDSTSILPILAYKEAFRYGRFGTAAAMAVVTGIFLMIVGTIGIRMSRSEQQ